VLCGWRSRDNRTNAFLSAWRTTMGADEIGDIPCKQHIVCIVVSLAITHCGDLFVPAQRAVPKTQVVCLILDATPLRDKVTERPSSPCHLSFTLSMKDRMTSERPLTILCLAGYEKARISCANARSRLYRVLLLTHSNLADAAHGRTTPSFTYQILTAAKTCCTA